MSQNVTEVVKRLVVPLDSAATSFCYYINPDYDSVPNFVPLNALQNIVGYAKTIGAGINFLFGKTPPQKKHTRLIEEIDHVKIVPLPLAHIFPDAIVVINNGEIEQAYNLSNNSDRIIILRIERATLSHLNSYLRSLHGKFRRLNVIFYGVEDFTEVDFQDYSRSLNEVVDILTEWYLIGESLEINVLSDRLVLENMNNCNPGLEHVTIAPDGCIYLCPGFLYHSASDSIGTIREGMRIPNAQLLQIDHSPICRLCDAYHCKRCVYLNRKLTSELNTPSRQQCVLSHLERNASRRLRSALVDVQPPSGFQPIPEIDYSDPFELLARESEILKPSEGKYLTRLSGESGKIGGDPIPKGTTISIPPLERVDPWTQTSPSNTLSLHDENTNQNHRVSELHDLSIKELLIRIYEQQIDILRYLKR